MSDPFIGQIKQIAFTFAPKNYAYCDGEQLKTQEHSALYALIGEQFGGDGRTYFNLPDLRGRVPVNPEGYIRAGNYFGSEAVTLDVSTMANHTHEFIGTTSEGDFPAPHPSGTKILATAELHGATTEPQNIYGLPTNMISLNPNTMTLTGGDQAHSNIQPSLVIGFIIALEGIFPSRN